MQEQDDPTLPRLANQLKQPVVSHAQEVIVSAAPVGALVSASSRAQPTRGLSSNRRSPVRRSRRLWLVGLGLTVAGLLWFVARPLMLGPSVVTSPVIRADLVQTLVSSGRVETPFRVSVGSQITGVVKRVPVAEGQAVAAGDTLVILDVAEARALTAQAEGQVAQTLARMRQLRDFTVPSAQQALTEANATFLNMQQTYDRNLAAAGFDTPASRDAAKANLDIARARVRTTELQVASSRPGGSDYVLAESQLQQARANLEAARSRARYREVIAPRDGVLISRSVEVGDVVQPGKELMVLAPSGDADIVIRVDERNLGLVALGQSALVSADAYPNDTFPAKVVFINPAIDPLRASVEVKLRVLTSPAYLRQDMTVSVDIEAATRPQALIAAASDLHDLGTVRPWVLVAEDKHARRKEVTVGLVTAGRVEILSGLSEGDQLVPTAATTVGDGRRIRARSALSKAK
jgi:HlyD family secretion protein